MVPDFSLDMLCEIGGSNSLCELGGSNSLSLLKGQYSNKKV